MIDFVECHRIKLTSGIKLNSFLLLLFYMLTSILSNMCQGLLIEGEQVLYLSLRVKFFKSN